MLTRTISCSSSFPFSRSLHKIAMLQITSSLLLVNHSCLIVLLFLLQVISCSLDLHKAYVLRTSICRESVTLALDSVCYLEQVPSPFIKDGLLPGNFLKTLVFYGSHHVESKIVSLSTHTTGPALVHLVTVQFISFLRNYTCRKSIVN